MGEGKCHKTFLLWHRISGFGAQFLVLKALSGAGSRTVPAGKGVSGGRESCHKTFILATKHLPKPQNIVMSHKSELLWTVFYDFLKKLARRCLEARKRGTKHCNLPPNIYLSHKTLLSATKYLPLNGAFLDRFLRELQPMVERGEGF